MWIRHLLWDPHGWIQIIGVPGDCLLLTAFHSVIDTNFVRINFNSNWFYVVSENVVVKNQRNDHSVQCFEHPYVDIILLSFVLDVFVVHSWKNSGSISTNCPKIFMIISSPPNAIYVFTNTFGISKVIKPILCFASITPVVMIASDAAFRLVASSREMYALCVLSLGHILSLIGSSLFLFNKIRLSLALFLSRIVILLILIG